MLNRWQFFPVNFVNVDPYLPMWRQKAELVVSGSNLLTVIEKVILLPSGIDKAKVKSNELIEKQKELT